jgi:hypothetical protein
MVYAPQSSERKTHGPRSVDADGAPGTQRDGSGVIANAMVPALSLCGPGSCPELRPGQPSHQSSSRRTGSTSARLSVPPAGIEPATRGLGTGAQLEQARERLARSWESIPLNNPSRRVETPSGELDCSGGKVAAEIASLDRRVTTLETEATSGRRAPRPSVGRAKGCLVIEPFTVAEKHLQILNGV